MGKIIHIPARVGNYMSVAVDIDDIILNASPADIAQIAHRGGLPSAFARTAPGDPSIERFVEAAYLAAKAMPEVPRPIWDLLWHVHGRAI